MKKTIKIFVILLSCLDIIIIIKNTPELTRPGVFSSRHVYVTDWSNEADS